MDAGELVPDEIMVGVVEERLAERDVARAAASCSTASRARWCRPRRSTVTRRPPLDVVVDLEVPEEVVLERIAVAPGLRELRSHLLHRGAARQHDWTCDACGGEVVQRGDDTARPWPTRLDALRAPRPCPRSTGTPAPACSSAVDGLGTARRGHRPAHRRHRRPPRGLSSPHGRVAAATSCARCARAGRVVAEMHERIRAAIRPGVTTGELDRIGREVIESRGAHVELPRLPRVPGRDLRVAQRRDRARHPGRRRCSTRATSSPSTAGRSSTAGTATPPSPPRSARSTAEAAAPHRGHRASRSMAGIAAMVAGRPPGRRRRRRAGGRRGRRVLGGAGVRRPRHRHGRCTRSPRSRTTAGRARAPSSRAGMVLALEPMVNVGRARHRPPRRRLDRGHRRRLAVGPLRAHHRRHRRRPGDPHPALSRRATVARSRALLGARVWNRARPPR